MQLVVVALLGLAGQFCSGRAAWFDGHADVEGAEQHVRPRDGPPAVPGENPLLYCANSDVEGNILDITRVDLTPNPPQAGKELVIAGVGELKDRVEPGAYVNIQVKYGVIQLLRQQIDLCEQVSEVNLTCPIEPGQLEITKAVDLPEEIPPGRYSVVADVKTADGRPITCLTAQVAFYPGQGLVSSLWEYAQAALAIGDSTDDEEV